MNHSSGLSRALLALLFAAALAPSPSLAQQPTTDALRQRVEALRTRGTIPDGTLVSIEYLLDISERIEGRFDAQSVQWRARAERFIESAEAGRDPYPEGRGQILNRAYRATFSPQRQGYAIYVPPDYDPSRSYPMLVMLHGGSSNGNLFLGVVLGNNMDWETYNQHLWDDYTPRWSPQFIVVAPDGVGQLIWRWMGEQDVLQVIDDVQAHYNVDPQRIVLGGLSNGGMGAYSVGARHAWRFSHVQAIAGAPSWLQYAGGSPTPVETTAMLPHSAMHVIENTTNTDFRYYHGTEDPGPMRPHFVRALTEHMRSLGLTPQERWFNHGHDLLYLVHRHGRVYDELAQRVRNPRPREVRVVTGDYRANRQHWITITRFQTYPELARVHATVEGSRIALTTDNALEVAIDLRDAPVEGATVQVLVDGASIYDGPRAHLGHVVHVSKTEEGAWHLGFLATVEGLEKVPRLSGPITDAYNDDIVHVYGTQNAENREALERTARAGATGWPVGVWYLNQRVVADTEVTDEMMRSAHLALYGSPGDNAILERIREQLPIRVESDAVVLGNGQRFEGRDMGVRFIYPSPIARGRYVLVHAGVTAEAVSRTRNLPDFLPDYVVYNRQTTATRPRLIGGRQRQLAAGYFDRFWRLPAAPTANAADAPPHPGGITPEEMERLAITVGAPPDYVLPPAVLEQTPTPELEPGEAPDNPPRPRRFAAPAADPNGPLARTIARLVPTFLNFRAIVAGGVWTSSDRAVWRIRAEATCLEELDEASVPYERYVGEPLVTPTPTPVVITGAVGGVAFTSAQPDEPVLLSCEMAARLPVLARIVRRHGVRGIAVLSSYRTEPRQSFHTLGMALDISAFSTSRGRMVVNDHFVETPAHTTCDAPEPEDWRAASLLGIACALGDSARFSSVLTPNYNEGHRNHFHVDIRPDDPRVFVR